MKAILAFLIVLLAMTPAPAQEAAPPHVDWEGNPLPAEAVARVGSTRFRLPRGIMGMALSPDNKTLACLCGDDKLYFLDTETGKHLRSFPLEMARYSCRVPLRYQPDGKAIVVFTRDLYRVVDAQTGKDLRKPLTIKAPDGNDHVFSPDGKLLAVLEKDWHITIHDLHSGNQLCTIRGSEKGQTPKLVFSADGQSLAWTNYDDEGIGVHETKTGRLQFLLPQPKVFDLAISPDGKRLAACGGDAPKQFQVIWDLEKRRVAAQVNPAVNSTPVNLPIFSPRGNRVLFGGYRDSVFVDTATAKAIHSMRTWPPIRSGVFSSDGNKVYAASENTVQPWDLKTGQIAQPSLEPRISPHWSRPYFFHHGRHLLIADHPLALVDWQTGRILRRFPASNTEWFGDDVLSPNEKWIASLTGDFFTDKVIRLIDVSSGKTVHRLQLGNEYPWVTQFSADSKKLVCFTNKYTIQSWDVATGKLFFRRTDSMRSAAYAVRLPNRQLLLTTNQFLFAVKEPELQIWDTGDERPFKTIPWNVAMNSPSFSLDGKTMAVWVGNPPGTKGLAANDLVRITLIDFLAGKHLKTWPTTTKEHTLIALCPNSRTVVAVEEREGMVLWEVASGKARHRIKEGHMMAVGPILFDPSGSLLAAASADAPIFIWDVYGKHLNKKPAAQRWSDQDNQRYWDTLASDDAVKAFAAVRALVQNPPAALELLDERLQPVKPVEERRFLDLVKGLDDENFARRKKALAELEQLGEQVEGWLLRETEAKQPLEVQRRLEQIVARLDKRSGDSLRGTRALEALEQIGGAEAERLVARLADSFAAARLTREAKETREGMRQARVK